MKRFPLFSVASLSIALVHISASSPAAPPKIQLRAIGSVRTPVTGVGAAEIVAHDPSTHQLLVTNFPGASLDVIDASNPAAPVLLGSIDLTPYGSAPNSVAVRDGIIAVAVEATVRTDPGSVVFFNSELQFVASIPVGAVPDMVTFTPNGRFVLTANEGEPSLDYSIDPEGSVSIIDLSEGLQSLDATKVRTADFSAFNNAVLDPSIRIFGPGATVAQDLEPEFITISNDSKTAWVTLQENNAIAIVDLTTATVKQLVGLGTKDHSVAGNGLDASDRDSKINIRPWPVRGFYLPDGIAYFRAGAQEYLLLANEGDARDYDGFSEETRVGNVMLDPAAFPNAATLKLPANLGRLKMTSAQGDPDHDGDFDTIYTFGARSFSVRSITGGLIWDSGDQFERITAAAFPSNFNASHDSNAFDSRSDDKGPEPESVIAARINGRQYAIIGLERIGGLLVYDLSVPIAPEFVQYINNRNFAAPVTSPEAGDLGPEGLLFVPAEESSNGKPWIVVANEVSGTTTIYEVDTQ
jgi:hypothetical protein